MSKFATETRMVSIFILGIFLLAGPVVAQEEDEDELSPLPETKLPERPQDKDDRMWVDGFRDGMSDFVDGTARWVDDLFGDPLNPSDYDDNPWQLSVAPQWDEHDGWEVDSSFRAKLVLPNAESRFSAIIGRGDFDDFITDNRSPRPSVIRSASRDEEWLLGLGFDPYVNNEHDLDFGAGIRGGIALDPYVRGRYGYESTFGNDTEYYVQSVAFWRDSDGFGVAQDFHIEHAFSDRWISRWYGRATFAERTEGVRWQSDVKVFYLYHHEKAIAGELFYYGETRWEVPVNDYGVRAIHRQRYARDWLFMESWIGLHWPRDDLSQNRKSRWMFGIEFEILFGGHV